MPVFRAGAAGNRQTVVDYRRQQGQQGDSKQRGFVPDSSHPPSPDLAEVQQRNAAKRQAWQ